MSPFTFSEIVIMESDVFALRYIRALRKKRNTFGKFHGWFTCWRSWRTSTDFTGHKKGEVIAADKRTSIFLFLIWNGSTICSQRTLRGLLFAFIGHGITLRRPGSSLKTPSLSLFMNMKYSFSLSVFCRHLTRFLM